MSEPDPRISVASAPGDQAPGAASPADALEGGTSERTLHYDVPSRDEVAAALEEFAPDAEPAETAHAGASDPDVAASASSATDASLRPSRGSLRTSISHAGMYTSTSHPGMYTPISRRGMHTSNSRPGMYTPISRRGLNLWLFGLLLAVAAESLFIGLHLFGQDRPQDTATDGAIVLHSWPSGAQVLIDGRSSGQTPLRVRVWPGSHVIQLHDAGGAVRRQRISIAAGQTASQYLALETKSPSPSRRPAVTNPSSTASVARRPRRPATGRVRIASEIPLLVFEGGKRIGSTDAGQLELRGGDHLVTLVNERFGFRSAQMIQVAAGRTENVAVALPKGLLSANATPWAEVIVSGRSLGETPIGETMLPLGHYNVVFRHPQLGERRVRVTIRADRPSIATVDFSD